jgi:hypothetical protein
LEIYLNNNDQHHHQLPRLAVIFSRTGKVFGHTHFGYDLEADVATSQSYMGDPTGEYLDKTSGAI